MCVRRFLNHYHVFYIIIIICVLRYALDLPVLHEQYRRILHSIIQYDDGIGIAHHLPLHSLLLLRLLHVISLMYQFFLFFFSFVLWPGLADNR